jgi:hypothetical protein
MSRSRSVESSIDHDQSRIIAATDRPIRHGGAFRNGSEASNQSVVSSVHLGRWYNHIAIN